MQFISSLSHKLYVFNKMKKRASKCKINTPPQAKKVSPQEPPWEGNETFIMWQCGVCRTIREHHMLINLCSCIVLSSIEGCARRQGGLDRALSSNCTKGSVRSWGVPSCIHVSYLYTKAN